MPDNNESQDKAQRDYAVTPELQAQFCALVSLGCSIRRAATLIGVPESTVRSTIDRDAYFAERVRNAGIQREVVPLKHIRNAQEKSWRAAAYMLERTNPHDYSRRWPRQPTAAELSDILDRYSANLMNEVPAPELRKAILEKLDRITAALSQTPDIWQKDPPYKLDPHSPSWVDDAFRRAKEEQQQAERQADDHSSDKAADPHRSAVKSNEL